MPISHDQAKSPPSDTPSQVVGGARRRSRRWLWLGLLGAVLALRAGDSLASRYWPRNDIPPPLAHPLVTATCSPDRLSSFSPDLGAIHLARAVDQAVAMGCYRAQIEAALIRDGARATEYREFPDDRIVYYRGDSDEGVVELLVALIIGFDPYMFYSVTYDANDRAIRGVAEVGGAL